MEPWFHNYENSLWKNFEKGGESMGYNQHNAGIHLIPHGHKGSVDSFQPYDKYGAIIAENHMINDKSDNKILEDIRLCNFILIAEKRGQIKHCVCGGKLNYKEKLAIKFHKKGKMSSMYMDGKQCIDCERKMVIKGELLSKIKDYY